MLSASSAKLSPATPAGRHQGRRVAQGQADNADRHRAIALAEAADGVSGKERAAVLGADIGGEVAEAGAGEIRVEPAGPASGVLRAAAILHAQQLGAAAIEFVVADRGEIEADQVHRQDGRLVEKLGGDERRGADQVAGRDHDAVRLVRAQLPRRRRRDRRRRRRARRAWRRPARPSGSTGAAARARRENR